MAVSASSSNKLACVCPQKGGPRVPKPKKAHTLQGTFQTSTCVKLMELSLAKTDHRATFKFKRWRNSFHLGGNSCKVMLQWNTHIGRNDFCGHFCYSIPISRIPYEIEELSVDIHLIILFLYLKRTFSSLRPC